MKTILFITTYTLTFLCYGQFTGTYSYEKALIFNEMTNTRKHPCDHGQKYDYDVCEFESTNIKLEIDDELNMESQLYAEKLFNDNINNITRTTVLKHSPYEVSCNESLGYLTSPLVAVKAWIEEKGYNGDGHRRHMMASEECHKSDTKIGIGIVYDQKYKMYYVVLRTK